jgi:hypothetical protein
MPFMRRKTVDRLVAVRTGVLDERLREAERRIANGDLSVTDFERRLVRAESESSRSSALTEAQSTRLAEVQQQVTSAASHVRNDIDRRLAIFEELLSAISQRAAEDRRQVEAGLVGLEQRLTEHQAKMDRSLKDMDRRLDDGVVTAQTRADVQGLALELARISMDLRSDVARAVNELKSATRTEVEPAPDAVVDLVVPQPEPVIDLSTTSTADSIDAPAF